MNDKKHTRDYLFDNYKALLIFLVVVGHFIEPATGNNVFFNGLKWIIVSFHMPAFIFISGYFSKKTLSISNLMQKLAIPYLVYEIIYYCLYTFILHKDTGLYLDYPKFTLWYLLALFAWRVVTPFFKKIPHYMLISIIAGLVIGCTSIKGNYLSIGRIVFFYPYFLAGTCFHRESIARLRTHNWRIKSAVITAVISLLVLTGPLLFDYQAEIFYGRYNYDALSQGNLEGVLCRLACYAIGFILTYLIMALIPERKTCYSYIGTRTMAIYLFHGLICASVKHVSSVLKHANTVEESVAVILVCIALTVILSAPAFTSFTNAVTRISIPKIQSRSPQYRTLFTVR